MLRFRILASVVPLLVAAAFARGDLLPGARPCVAIGEGSVQITSLPWQAQSHVSFTRDPAHATVRVQLTDNAEAADFAVLDDVDSSEASACAVNPATRFVAISASPSASEPVIYLSQNGPADYRIFVRSKRFSARDAAALIVGARGAPQRSEPLVTRFLYANRHPPPCINLSSTTFLADGVKPAGLKHFARSPRHRRRRDRRGKTGTRSSA